jgi:hypothetical protein
LEPRFVDGDPAFASGRLGQSVELDGTRFVELGDVADYGELDKFSYSVWVYPRGARTGAVLARMDDADIRTGFELYLEAGHVQVNFVNRWLDDCLRLEVVEPLSPDAWHHVAVSYDGKMISQGVKIYVDGVLQPFKAHYDLFNNSFKVKQPLRLGVRTTTGRLEGLVDDRSLGRPGRRAAVLRLSALAGRGGGTLVRRFDHRHCRHSAGPADAATGAQDSALLRAASGARADSHGARARRSASAASD